MENEILNTSYKFNVQTDNYLETMYYPGIWRMIFNKSTIQSIRFPNQRIGEDVIFLTRIRFDKINKVYSENVVYKYFIGDNSHLSSSPMPPEVAYDYLCEILQGLESSIGFREDLSLMTLMRFLRLCLASRDMRWIFKSGCLVLRKTPKLVALSPQIVSILVRARKIKKKQLKMYS